MSKSKRLNRDHAKKTQRPMVEDRVIEDIKPGKLAGKMGVVINLVTCLPVAIWFQENPRASDTRFEESLLEVVSTHLSYLWTGSINGLKLQIWATWLFYAILVDLGDAVADEISLPLDRISLEMIYRGLYYFHGASTREEASDPVKYFAQPNIQKCLGIVKRQRKPKQKLIVALFPDKQRVSDQFFFQSSSKSALTPCLQG